MTKPRVGKRPAQVTSRQNAADADADAFAKEMRDVARLPVDGRGRVGRARPREGLPAAQPAGEQVEGSIEAFAASGIDRRELRKLKRGDYDATARTDLHGLNAVDARAATARFLENSRRRGHRCVCIVHGRGLHSERQAPVLRTQVREFLRSQRSVLAYSDAPPSDGGPGAVYVLLRK